MKNNNRSKTSWLAIAPLGLLLAGASCSSTSASATDASADLQQDVDAAADTAGEATADAIADADLDPARSGITLRGCFDPTPAQSGGGGPGKTCTTDVDCATYIPGYRLCGSKGYCSQCKSDTDCTADASRPKCALTNNNNVGVCMACVADSDCTAGPDNTGKCLAGACKRCDSDSDCVNAGLGAACRNGQCAACTDDSYCTAGTGTTGYCWGGRCDACRSDQDCLDSGLGRYCNRPAGSPLHGRCVECLYNAHCVGRGTGKCANNLCEGCESNADCAPLPDPKLECCNGQGSGCL
ncbi:MAG: hypothetical protein KC503_03155 [Myxococcales bacterium]|nr:hypothetical protein [Myxococcales bacterium]